MILVNHVNELNYFFKNFKVILKLRIRKTIMMSITYGLFLCSRLLSAHKNKNRCPAVCCRLLRYFKYS